MPIGEPLEEGEEIPEYGRLLFARGGAAVVFCGTRYEIESLAAAQACDGMVVAEYL